MKSIVMKSIYAGLGLIGTGTETVAQLGRKIARQANVSEQEGEKLARKLHAQSDKALRTIRKTVDSEVKIIVDTVRPASHNGHKAAAGHHTNTRRAKPRVVRISVKAGRRARPAKHAARRPSGG